MGIHFLPIHSCQCASLDAELDRHLFLRPICGKVVGIKNVSAVLPDLRCGGCPVFHPVFAGVLRDDSEQGVLFVSPAGGTELKGGWYNTPIKTGSVHVVSGSGSQIVLESNQGETFYFDVLGQTYIASLGEIVPTRLCSSAEGVVPAFVYLIIFQSVKSISEVPELYNSTKRPLVSLSGSASSLINTFVEKGIKT